MSRPLKLGTTASLGSVDPCGSRQLGRRSSVCITDDLIAVGLADGSLAAYEIESEDGTTTSGEDGTATVSDDNGTATDGDTLTERWRHEPETADERGSVVTLISFGNGVLAGERGPAGEIRLHDAATGDVRWRYQAADDVGGPQKQTRFFLPFVADAVTAGDRAYAAVRRYERGQDGERTFQSVVYAFAPDGEVVWRYRTDASPIAVDADDTGADTDRAGADADSGRVAVAFNRCPGNHSDGVVVLDGTTGDVNRRWDPDGDGDRRVGDVSLLPDGLAVASHADYRGYRLDEEGVRWRVDLARPVETDGETVYAYPNHVHATDDGVVFLTGNTYPEDGRETDRRHPNEHTAIGVTAAGDRRWSATVGGFTHGIASEANTILAPVAQHFRERDPEVHGLRRFDVVEGERGSTQVPGVVTATAVAGEGIAAVEEPVSYHDDADVRGAYRLRICV